VGKGTPATAGGRTGIFVFLPTGEKQFKRLEQNL
jgi:hypothetical protein